MKVGLDAHSLMRLPRCGMHHHTYEVFRALAELFPDDRYLLFFDRSLLSDPALDRRLIDGMPANYEPVPLRAFGRTRATAELAWLHWHLPRAIARSGVDVFHAFSHTLPRTTRCPTVLTVHDLMPAALLSWVPGDRQAVRKRQRLLSAVHRATAICAVSEGTRKDVLAALRGHAKPVDVVPNAVRDSLRRVTAPETLRAVSQRHHLPGSFLLSVGSDMPRRNYARLIEALDAASRNGAPLPPLVLVGSARWHETRAFQHARESGVGDRVLFLSDVPDADLAAIYSLAAAYVCPSLHEGFAMPVLEAMTVGTPVACSDLPVLRELAGDHATYFPPDDSVAMAQALTAMCGRLPIAPQARQDLASLAFRFTWRDSAVRVRQLYGRLLQHDDLQTRRPEGHRTAATSVNDIEHPGRAQHAGGPESDAARTIARRHEHAGTGHVSVAGSE